MSNSLEAKIVVLGAQGVGKTSLVQRYVRNSFNPSTTVSTVGASFVTKRVLDSTSDTIVRLQIWDTAGQERFRSISRLYYRGANAGVLCYDITDEDSFREMTGWLGELKENLGEENPIIIHVVGTKSDIVADDPSKRKVPFEKTIAYVAEQLYPSQASTPPPSSGMGMLGASAATASNHNGPESKRSSGFWGQDIGWDCCHEISAKDGEGIEEVFRVITRKLVEQKNKKVEAQATRQRSVRRRERPSTSIDGHTIDNNADKRRSWLGFPPTLVLNDESENDETNCSPKRKQGKCC
ncbi:hypothetical protein UREG_02809 [Uncinocarpus reesii 1704]|uniref:GTP-binding protein ypt3 n=1 Tax=Uncinocarpus reesii (strain UAMH 1704) TaxID=336963 RepID=C4JI63_UNCRE|nr:uncharacterized protein UREG_02809 [Uncinocarpus reesii 1704]EEP77960.1 hypothetical protein UREG_02809 [Uncinocarpus reesii 1704]